MKRQRLGAEEQHSELNAQLKQLPLTTAATQHQLREQLAQLDASMAQNDVARDVVLRATRAGTVASLLIEPGQATAEGQSLLSILPNGSPLEAQLLVPSSAIGFVHDGTPVVLHYQAYPYQKFDVQHGTVEEVSRSALTPAQVTTLLGQAPPPAPLYRVEVKLARQSIDAYGKRQTWLPERDIILAKRSPLFDDIRVTSATPFRYDPRLYPRPAGCRNHQQQIAARPGQAFAQLWGPTYL